jgi:hypothetical protein
MAENEVIKHASKAYAIFRSSDMSLKKKSVEIIIEILIIVFAISVSIWLHNWSESVNDRKEEKEFLTGLKKDLQSDIDNMTSSKEFYRNTVQGIKYFLTHGKGENLPKDSVYKYSEVFFGSTDLDPHIGRYEGLKSSGRFRIIRNKELLNNIIDFNETVVQRIQILNEKYYQQMQKLADLVEHNLELSKTGDFSNAESLLQRNDMRILLQLSGGLIVNNIISVHESGINKCKEIIRQIDEELK